jgi:competence ComEA-like helix-hairpin-helix protein
VQDHLGPALVVLFVLLCSGAFTRTFYLTPRLTTPRRAAPCDRAIEVAGIGVGCLPPEAGRGLVSGDRLLRGGLGRMAPVRLATFSVKVAVNRADIAELSSLSGIGPKLAARIVAARPFASLADLARVPGVGARRVERLRTRLTLDDGDGLTYAR